MTISTVTGKGVVSINTFSIATTVYSNTVMIINIDLTSLSSEASITVTGERIDSIHTLAMSTTTCCLGVIDVQLTHLTSKPSTGYTGVLCDVNIDDCIGVCSGNGQCMDEVASFTCLCSPGYTGVDCEININECIYGSGNGQCVDDIDSLFATIRVNVHILIACSDKPQELSSGVVAKS